MLTFNKAVKRTLFNLVDELGDNISASFTELTIGECQSIRSSFSEIEDDDSLTDVEKVTLLNKWRLILSIKEGDSDNHMYPNIMQLDSFTSETLNAMIDQVDILNPWVSLDDDGEPETLDEKKSES